MAKYDKYDKYEWGALRKKKCSLLRYATICDDLRKAFAFSRFATKYEIRMAKYEIIILAVWRNTTNTTNTRGDPSDISINVALALIHTS